jgi:hypothetical protein
MEKKKRVAAKTSGGCSQSVSGYLPRLGIQQWSAARIAEHGRNHRQNGGVRVNAPRRTNCKCGRPRRKGGRYCLSCHASHQRRWWNPSRPSPQQRMKRNARSYAKVYQKRGKLIPQPCEVQGCQNRAEKHHDDYLHPLNVRWICREHHLELHRRLTPTKTI